MASGQQRRREERGLRGGWIMGIKMDHNEIRMGGLWMDSYGLWLRPVTGFFDHGKRQQIS